MDGTFLCFLHVWWPCTHLSAYHQCRPYCFRNPLILQTLRIICMPSWSNAVSFLILSKFSRNETELDPTLYRLRHELTLKLRHYVSGGLPRPPVAMTGLGETRVAATTPQTIVQSPLHRAFSHFTRQCTKVKTFSSRFLSVEENFILLKQSVETRKRYILLVD